jgi:hypothetical protein
MNRTEGLLVVDRLALMRLALRADRLKGLRDGEAPEAVFRRYRGFDGQPWPVEAHPQFRTDGGLAGVADRRAVEAYLRGLPNAGDCELLLLVRVDTAAFKGTHRAGWSFAGFDVGFFESEWSHYSVVLHQVIWGRLPELASFANRLGPYLLLGALRDALALVSAHERVRAAGGDVEEGAVQPMAVFLPA